MHRRICFCSLCTRSMMQGNADPSGALPSGVTHKTLHNQHASRLVWCFTSACKAVSAGLMPLVLLLGSLLLLLLPPHDHVTTYRYEPVRPATGIRVFCGLLTCNKQQESMLTRRHAGFVTVQAPNPHSKSDSHGGPHLCSRLPGVSLFHEVQEG